MYLYSNYEIGQISRIIKNYIEYCSINIINKEIHTNSINLIKFATPVSSFEKKILLSWMCFRDMGSFFSFEQHPSMRHQRTWVSQYLTKNNIGRGAMEENILHKACDSPFRFFVVHKVSKEICLAVDSWTGQVLRVVSSDLLHVCTQDVIFGHAVAMCRVALFTHQPIIIPFSQADREQASFFLRNVYRLVQAVAHRKAENDKNKQEILLENQSLMLARQYFNMLLFKKQKNANQSYSCSLIYILKQNQRLSNELIDSINSCSDNYYYYNGVLEINLDKISIAIQMINLISIYNIDLKDVKVF